MTRAVDANEAAALVGDYMAGRLADPPWGAFGLSREPVICGASLAALSLCRDCIPPYSVRAERRGHLLKFGA